MGDDTLRTDPGTGGIEIRTRPVDPLRAEVDRLRVETDRLGTETDPLRSATVLMVSVGYAPQTAGAAPQATVLARDLASVAERVVVLTGSPPRTGSRLRRTPRRSFDHDRGAHLVRHRYAGHGDPGDARPGSERGFLRAVLGTPVRTAPDVVIGLLPTAAAAVAAARLAARSQVPLVLVVQDLVGPGTSGMPPGAPLARGQVDALRQAARVVVVSNRLRAMVIAQGVAQERVELLTDWTAGRPEVPAPAPATARSRIGLPADGFLVAHVGNIGTDQDVPLLIAAARLLAGRGAHPIRFIVVGEGSRRESLELAVADRPEVTFLDPVTAGRYPALLAAADVLVVAEPPGRNDRTLPSRLRSYQRIGRPVVAAVNPGGDADLALLALQEQPGRPDGAAPVVTVPPGDARALAAALARLHDAASGGPGGSVDASGAYGPVADAPVLPVPRDPAVAGRATDRLRDVLRAVLHRS